MSHDSDSAVDAALIGERRHLLSLAFRMLGTVAEAEDAVQETYVRWYRMDQAERVQVRVPRAWLTRAASRICLDMLGTARARRERYVGPWLPEPVPILAFTETGPDPLDQVTLDDSVSTALLVVLEAMTPAERVAFVLHDLFAVPFSEMAQIVGRTPPAWRQRGGSARARGRRRGPVRRPAGTDRRLGPGGGSDFRRGRADHRGPQPGVRRRPGGPVPPRRAAQAARRRGSRAGNQRRPRRRPLVSRPHRRRRDPGGLRRPDHQCANGSEPGEALPLELTFGGATSS